MMGFAAYFNKDIINIGIHTLFSFKMQTLMR